jgi:hypothetical protein
MFDTQGLLAEIDPLDQAISPQLTKMLRKHFLRNAWHTPPQLRRGLDWQLSAFDSLKQPGACDHPWKSGTSAM